MKFSLFPLISFSLIAHAKASPRPQVSIMGWSSWNHFRINIDDGIVLPSVADDPSRDLR